MDFIKHQLPGAYYNDPQIFKKEIEHIFNKTWQYVCQESELTGLGSYITTTLGSEPVIILKGSNGQLRAFHNVCPHRGAKRIWLDAQN